MVEIYEGRCLCGDIHFKATGKPKWVLWCHCQSCRRHSGAPASVFVAFADDAVSLTSGMIAKMNPRPASSAAFLCALWLHAHLQQSETAGRDALPHWRVRTRR